MKNDVVNLIKKLKEKSPFVDGKCIYCGGSENSKHYPDCIVNDVNRIIDKYRIPVTEKAKKAIRKDENKSMRVRARETGDGSILDAKKTD